MKNIALLLFGAMVTLVSCKKDDGFAPIKFPEPPGITKITYRVYKYDSKKCPYLDTMSANSFTRKITFLCNWTDSAGVIVPEYCDTIVTGDFIFTVEMLPKRGVNKYASADTPGKYHYEIPLGIGWHNTDGKSSYTTMDAVVENTVIKFAGNACAQTSRPFAKNTYYFPGLDGSGLYDR
jgi:hypothetical protein